MTAAAGARGCRQKLATEHGLISIDASGPIAAEVPPEARLDDAPHLQAVHEPSPRLALVPRHVLQQDAQPAWTARLRRLLGMGGGAVLVHAVLAATFLYLLSFRDVEMPREVEIPVEVVRDVPKAPAAATPPKGSGGQSGSAQPSAGPHVDPTKPAAPGGPSPIQAKPLAPPQDAKLAPASSGSSLPPPPPASGAPGTAGPAAPPPPAPQVGEAGPPTLVAPPPEAAKSATQDKDNKPANLVPDDHQADQATREAKPVAVPQVLTTGDTKAETAVPTPVKPPPVPVDKPAPPIPAKVPSAADKLAAALPMDAAAMPMSFRSVLAGNATAQINAAYQGVVQGRIRQAQAELARTAYAQHLSGNIAIAFTIDDAGKISSLGVAQSSGNAQLDALALHAIELAAPFPAPPPEADHTFKKAFLVGG